jgi:meso-butanediol dehydrogenase/(S,S)-butanediol dehydrogenase/diacetyl reductase
MWRPRLPGKVVLVTGGTSGIGLATAHACIEEGAAGVVVTGRRDHAGQEAQVALTAHADAVFAQVQALTAALPQGLLPVGLPARPCAVTYLRADHSVAADCSSCVAASLAAHGRIDVLFNNAGLVTQGTAEETSEEEWSEVMAVNVTAVWRMCRLVLPHMRAHAASGGSGGGGGVIINNASDWAVVGARGAAAYAVSKAAVLQLSRCLALDHMAEGIRVNAVCPGDTAVARWRSEGYFRGSGGVSAEEEAAGGASLPMGRAATTDEIARAVVFLASDDASYVQGAGLMVDGGNTAQ